MTENDNFFNLKATDFLNHLYKILSIEKNLVTKFPEDLKL